MPASGLSVCEAAGLENADYRRVRPVLPRQVERRDHRNTTALADRADATTDDKTAVLRDIAERGTSPVRRAARAKMVKDCDSA